MYESPYGKLSINLLSIAVHRLLRAMTKDSKTFQRTTDVHLRIHVDSMLRLHAACFAFDRFIFMKMIRLFMRVNGDADYRLSLLLLVVTACKLK